MVSKVPAVSLVLLRSMQCCCGVQGAWSVVGVPVGGKVPAVLYVETMDTTG